MSDCKELIGNLSDFIDGELDPELCRQLKEHLDGCKNCRLMADSLNKTVKLCRDGVIEELPESLQKSLNQKLRERWKAKFDNK